MSNIITQSLEGSIMHTFSLVNEFVKVCPENVWGQQFGRWPVWQQLYHAFTAMDFFLRPLDSQPEIGPFNGEIGDLKEIALETPAKLILQEYLEKAQAKVAAYIATLDDAVLAQKNEGLSARMGRDLTHAFTLALIASHTMYHLGSCDAALRENGLSGVF